MFSIFLAVIVVIESKSLENCQYGCELDFSSDLHTFDDVNSTQISTVFLKLPQEKRLKICWHFYDYIHCLTHCSSLSDINKWEYLNETCPQETAELSKSFDCINEHHSVVESHCSSFMDEAIRQQNAIISESQLKEKICGYLDDHTSCLVANMEYYCGTLAVKVFTKENLNRYFRTYIESGTRRLLRPEVLKECYGYETRQPLASDLLHNITQNVDSMRNILEKTNGFSIALLVFICILSVLLLVQLLILFFNRVLIRLIYLAWKEVFE